VELGDHVHHRADPLALGTELCVLERPFLDLLELELQLQAAHAERHLHGRAPVIRILHLEALDPWEELRHPRRVLQHRPDERRRCVELLGPLDLHALNSTDVPRPSARARSNRYSAAKRSSTARPRDSKTVISSGDVRPGWLPTSTSPSSAAMWSARMAPSL